jgi:hypothetical protein
MLNAVVSDLRRLALGIQAGGFSAACYGDGPQCSDDQQREGERRWQASMVCHRGDEASNERVAR